MSDGEGGSPGARPLWHGRFAEPPADELRRVHDSLAFDRRLAPDDLVGSRAHVAMLARVGLLTGEEAAAVTDALDRVGQELDGGTFAFEPSDEDIHTAIERRVTEIAGPAGAKLHTGRSRNDQIALDIRLYLRREGRALVGRIHELQEVLLDAGRGRRRRLPPGVHAPAAGPARAPRAPLARALLGASARDVDRWRDALDARRRVAAGRGRARGLEPAARSRQRRRRPRLRGGGSRTRSTRCPIATSSPRRCSSPRSPRCTCRASARRSCSGRREEFGFLRLTDAYSTGSSMLPQKKNPDIAELARGAAGRLIGDLTGVLATLKGLPLSYNRDLQGDKEPLFDALDTTAGTRSGQWRACSRRPSSTPRACRRPPTARAAPRPISPSTSSSRASRSARRTRSSAPWSAVARAGDRPGGAGPARAAPRPGRAGVARAGPLGAAAHDARWRRTRARARPAGGGAPLLTAQTS